MNAYEAKQAAKKARLEDRAEALAGAADATFKRGHDMASVIPFGQPILVGHHSEGRDRNYRKRITQTFDKSVALHKAAEKAAERAASVGTGGISSDDPDAVAKLQAQLTDAEADQARMKEANAAIRKRFKTDAARTEALQDLGFGPTVIARLLNPPYGKPGFGSWELSNNNANIRRLKDRISSLESAREQTAKTPITDCEGNGYIYRIDATENRVMLIFPGKPVPYIRDLLRSHGFLWSPSRTAWTRKLTNAARYAGECICKCLDTATVIAAE